MALTDKTKALEIIEARFGSLPDDAELLLEASKGKAENDDSVWRPYAVLAELISVNWNRYTSVVSASGSSVAYNSPEEARDALSKLQSRLDAVDIQSGITIPESWQNPSSNFERTF